MVHKRVEWEGKKLIVEFQNTPYQCNMFNKYHIVICEVGGLL